MSTHNCMQCGADAPSLTWYKESGYCNACMESSCLLCEGWRRGMIRRAGACWLCPWCGDLTEEEVQIMLATDAVKPAFTVWSAGRREESLETSKRARLEVEQPGQVWPQLFLGDLDAAMAIPKLEERGIKAVLNLCPERLGAEPYGDLPARLRQAGIEYLGIAARDACDFDMLESVVPASCEFIDACLQRGGVLVNCWGGVNRSATVVVAFLVKELWWKA